MSGASPGRRRAPASEVPAATAHAVAHGGPAEPVLVLGVGNLLMGDEGVGVHTVRFLEGRPLPPRASLLDGGTGGFHLLSYLMDYRRVVVIDATRDGKPAGTITLLNPTSPRHFPATLSTHDIGLKDLVEAATLLERLPQMTLITVSVESLRSMCMELSPPVLAAVPKVAGMVQQMVETAA